MQTAKHVKNLVLFIACIGIAFFFSRYGMPLYSFTSFIVDGSYHLFSHNLQDVYESGSDPITFTTLIVMELVYAAILFALIKIIAKKLKGR